MTNRFYYQFFITEKANDSFQNIIILVDRKEMIAYFFLGSKVDNVFESNTTQCNINENQISIYDLHDFRFISDEYAKFLLDNKKQFLEKLEKKYLVDIFDSLHIMHELLI